MLQLIAAFHEFGHDIVFASTATQTPYSFKLDTIGVRSVSIQLNHSSFDEFVQELNPAVVIFDRFMTEEQFGWRVAETVPNAVRILNTEDLHSLRKSREVCFKKGVEWEVQHWQDHPMTLRELASILRSDLTLMISSFEMDLLMKHANISEDVLMHLPFLLEVPSAREVENWPSFKARQHFVCVGNGKHEPNVAAFKYLQRNIWPKIKKRLPEAKLFIYGAYQSQQILELNNLKAGLEVKGWTEDLYEELQKARVLLAPLQFGAGIKGKLVDAMLNGTPSITTGIGAEGMHGALPWPGAIGHDEDSFVDAAVELYQNKDAWQLGQKHGLELLRTHYSKDKNQKLFQVRLQDIQNTLVAHRNANPISKILQQQQYAASKYMGKWIEEKNRN